MSTKFGSTNVGPTKFVICAECNSCEGIVVCKCSKDHKMCRMCSEKTIRRAAQDNNGFYKKYINWCDACIWWDIG